MDTTPRRSHTHRRAHAARARAWRLAAAALAACVAATAPAQPAPTLTLTPTANPVAPGVAVTFSAQLAGVSPTGTVDFAVDGAALCSAVAVVPSGIGGLATCATSTLPVGDHTILARYSGDADDGPATSAPLTFWVATACRAPTTPTLTMPAVTWLRSWHAGLAAPSRIAVAADGRLLVADAGTGAVVSRAVNGASTTIATPGHALSIAAGSGGRSYVGDAVTGQVRAYDAAGQFAFALGAGAGEFGHPGDIAVDAAANEVFVADTDRHVIRVYDAATGAHLRTLGRYGRADAQFHTPTGLALDGGVLLVADQLNYRVQAIDKTSGAFVECIGTYSQSGFISGGGGPSRTFGMVQGLAVDAAGRLYLTDAFQGVVRVIDRAAAATLGTIGAFGQGSAKLSVPTDVAIDGNGRLFVAAADSGKLEAWGIGTFADPDAIAHATASLVPPTYNRFQPPPAVRVVLELPDVAPSAIDVGSLRVNGLAVTASAGGDSDRNGRADLAFDVDGAALTATLGGASGPVDVQGTAGAFAFSARTTLALASDPVPTVVTLTASAGTIPAGAPVTLTAAIAGLSPTGTVRFVNGATSLCDSVAVVAGAAQCSTTLPAGFHALTASYSGDVDDAAGLSAPLDLDVTQALPAITLASAANPAPAGAPVALTVDVVGLAPTGLVDVLDGATPLCLAVELIAVDATHSRAQCATAPLAIGQHSLVASYLGDPDNAAGLSAVLVQTIALGASSTALTSSPNPSTPGAPAMFTATVTGTGPVGSVTFREGSTVLCAAVTPVTQSPATATASCAISTLSVGAHAVVAEFAGDAANAPSASAPHTHVVQATATAVTLASSANPSSAGQPVTFTATVSGNAPSGQVTFTDNATPLCAGVALAPLDAARSTAACPVVALSGGTHPIVASYGGDAGNGAGSSLPLAQVVNGGGVTTVSGPSPSGAGTITATISGCAFETWAFVNPIRDGRWNQVAKLFPYGLFEFTTTACAPGTTIAVTITYPQPLPAGTAYWKYGATSGKPRAHWYTVPATIAGPTVTFSVADGGLGDDDLAVNGRIVDPGGPAIGDVVAADNGSVPIPTLGMPALALIALIVAIIAALARRRAETESAR